MSDIAAALQPDEDDNGVHKDSIPAEHGHGDPSYRVRDVAGKFEELSIEEFSIVETKFC